LDSMLVALHLIEFSGVILRSRLLAVNISRLGFRK
jgi:hypothetical protein